MSAARAAARIKPVVVVKAGRHAQGAKAAQTHTGALAGSDAVYDAAFRRAGLLRVLDLDELFAAAETLGRLRPFRASGWRSSPMAAGIGILAVDRLIDLGGTLAGISPATMLKLDAALPPIWSKANPVDIAGDADPARYVAALEALIADPENDAVLVMNVPTALASASDRRPQRSPPSARAYRNSAVTTEAGLRRLGRHQRCRHADLRSRRHSELRDRIRGGARLHASGALPGGAGCLDGDAAEPAAGFQAGRRPRRATVVANAVAARPHVARSDRDDAAARGLCHSDRARAPRPRCRRGRGRRAPAAGAGKGRGGQNPLAGYRSQIGGRRRTPQPHQRGARSARRSPTSSRGRGPRGPTRASPA